MFSRSDGPTALRADLVRALSFSSQQCELQAQEGTSEPAVAALAGVWNGHKGFVALVVYRITSQNVERYVFADPIDNESGVDQAVDEGMAFAESFGFGMDAPDFVTLPPEQQEQRLRVWNKLRKPRPGIAAPVLLSAPRLVLEHTGDIDPTATPTPVPAAELPAAAAAPAAALPAAPAAPAAAAETSGGRAVLGRIELVRRGVEAPRPDPLIRLLSYL